MVQLLAVGRALPGPPHPQTDLAATIGPLLTDDPNRLHLLDRLHAATGVRTRHLVLPPDQYGQLRGFGQTNDLFLTRGGPLAAQVSRAALGAAGVPPEDVGFVLFTSVTGVAAPSLDVELVDTLGLPSQVRRLPSFGLGCAGGAAGVARMRDLLLGHPGAVGLLVSLELCSLTMQRGDDSTANLVACGLFGDGAAAVVMAGTDYVPKHPGVEPSEGAEAGPHDPAERADDPDHSEAHPPAPQERGVLEAAAAAELHVDDAVSHLYPGTQDQLGWRVGDNGFAIMLSAGLPDLIAHYLAEDVDGFLAAHDLDRESVHTWVVHAGGPRILDTVQTALDLPAGALQPSQDALAAAGNLSSASVLHILTGTLQRGDPPPGGYAMLLAFGPGVSAELVLVHRSDGTDRSEPLVAAPARSRPTGEPAEEQT